MNGHASSKFFLSDKIVKVWVGISVIWGVTVVILGILTLYVWGEKSRLTSEVERLRQEVNHYRLQGVSPLLEPAQEKESHVP